MFVWCRFQHAANLMWIPTFNLYVRKTENMWKVSLSPCCGNIHALQWYVTACIETWLGSQPQPTQKMGWLGLQTHIVTRPTGSGKAWSLAGLCVLALVRLSLFSSPLSDSKFTLSLLVFFFTYLRWFVWPNLRRVLIEDWKCITFPGKVSWEGVLETCHSESDCKSKGGCHMYEILEYSFYHFHKAYLTHKQNVHKHADCANQMAAGRANWRQKKAHA